MVEALARFAPSDEGRLWLAAHERFGLDPAAGIEDDVVAHSFRVALIVAHADTQDDDVTSGIVTDLEQRMKGVSWPR